MSGLGKVWKAFKGGRATGNVDGAAAQTATTIPRMFPQSRPAASEPAPEPAWTFAGVEPSETRSAERFVPNRTATVLTTASGKRLTARIINVSRTGVAVEVETAGIVQAEVTLVGSRPVTPGRRIALGMVFLFVKPLDPKLCGPDLVL